MIAVFSLVFENFMPVFCFLKFSSPCVAHHVVFSCLASVPSVMIKAFLRSLVILASWTSFKSEARGGWLEVVIISVETDNYALCRRVVRLYSWVEKTAIPESLSLFSWVDQVPQRRLPTSNLEGEGLAARRKRTLGDSASIMSPYEISIFNYACVPGESLFYSLQGRNLQSG